MGDHHNEWSLVVVFHFIRCHGGKWKISHSVVIIHSAGYERCNAIQKKRIPISQDRAERRQSASQFCPLLFSSLLFNSETFVAIEYIGRLGKTIEGSVLCQVLSAGVTVPPSFCLSCLAPVNPWMEAKRLKRDLKFERLQTINISWRPIRSSWRHWWLLLFWFVGC